MTREKAIAKLKAILEEATVDESAVCYVTSNDADALEMAIKALEQTEPERKNGKWIWDKRTGTYHCSECGHDPLHEDVGEIEEYKYCMNCGTKMGVDR